jgi:ABC-2 type transport system permease protein
MNRFLWLVRREIWEHKAIWVAPAVVIGCVILLLLTGRVHLGPFDIDGAPLSALSTDQKVTVLMYGYSALALVVFMVMGVIAFFYSIDALYADRRDRSVLFWKSLPLSDVETVLAKFAVAVVVIPLVALAATVATQLVIAAGESIKLAISGGAAGFPWEPRALFGGMGVAVVWCVTAMLWYSPLAGYLMLASAWAPRAPFLWAVLPPVALWIIEAVVMRSEFVGDFITERLFVMPYILRMQGDEIGGRAGESGHDIERLTSVDLYAVLANFYKTPDLWLGVAAAGLLLAAAMWVRRYRDETS